MLDVKDTGITQLPPENPTLPLRDVCLEGNAGLDFDSGARGPRRRSLRCAPSRSSVVGHPAVPEGVAGLTQLARFYVNHNDITEPPRPRARCVELEVLGAINNQIARVPDGARAARVEPLPGQEPGASEKKSPLSDAIREGFVLLGGA